jgi:small subunit ribosomal protein S9
MAEEEQNEETPQDEAPEAPAEEAPAADEAPEEASAAEEPAAEDAPAAEEPAAEGDQPASDPAAPGSEAEEAAGGDSKSEDRAAKDRPPGADLEPIAIEDERELTAEERARREAEAEERAAAEQAATADTSDEEPAPRKAAEVPADARIQATGKRKSAIARVVLTAGSGEFTVNGRELDAYFPRAHDQTVARQALVTAGYESSVNVAVRVHGGGVSGQAGAVRHGIARGLTEIEPELRRDLKRRGLLTRDAREKERRKAGLKKARKRPQFSKR